ncbi:MULTISPECIES: ABC transporter ATP-binding protein [unclassified Agarivorans]|uniref:ABC transporter ATP-binding protein n=1 Tax=unclassified Agarivorans TaxID=2636026 RepID=UPI003D7D563D
MIKLTQVDRRFKLGEQLINGLKQINLTIQAQEYVAVMGPSGSGKSTLLNVLGLLDRPDSGQYQLQGQDTAAMNERQLAYLRSTAIGFIFQSFHLVPRLTAMENIELPLILAGITPHIRQQKVSQLLSQLDLTARAEHRPEQLSGGQRQRVAIARAMVMNPALLLADEPTGNLDSHAGGEVIELLERLNRETGITLVVVTHDLSLGERARRMLQMADGAIIQDSGVTPHALA